MLVTSPAALKTANVVVPVKLKVLTGLISELCRRTALRLKEEPSTILSKLRTRIPEFRFNSKELIEGVALPLMTEVACSITGASGLLAVSVAAPDCMLR